MIILFFLILLAAENFRQNTQNKILSDQDTVDRVSDIKTLNWVHGANLSIKKIIAIHGQESQLIK